MRQVGKGGEEEEPRAKEWSWKRGLGRRVTRTDEDGEMMQSSAGSANQPAYFSISS